MLRCVVQTSQTLLSLGQPVPFDPVGLEIVVLLTPASYFPFKKRDQFRLEEGTSEAGAFFGSYQAQLERFQASGWRLEAKGQQLHAILPVTDLDDGHDAMDRDFGDHLTGACPLHIALLGAHGERIVAGGRLFGVKSLDAFSPPALLPALVHNALSGEQYIVSGHTGLCHAMVAEIHQLAVAMRDEQAALSDELDALVAAIVARETGVPSSVSIRHDAEGRPNLLEPRCELFVVPLLVCKWAGFLRAWAPGSLSLRPRTASPKSPSKLERESSAFSWAATS
jgi:hypothetical protein